MSETTTALPGTEAAAPVVETPAVETTTETIAAAPASETTETKAAETGTLVGNAAQAETKAVAAPADWPADWREKIAGGDAKELEQLKRQGSPVDLWKKARALEQKLSSGEYKRDLPKDATPEQVKEWRAERGIPEAPAGYLDKLTLPDGVVLGEADKPMAAAFAEAAFDGSIDPAQYSKLVAKYYDLQDKMAQQRAEADHAYKLKAEEELRGEFGGEFHGNLNRVKNLLAGMPEGAAANLLGGRLGDGTVIGDNPGVIKWLSSIARELLPTNTMLPVSADNGKSVDSRLTELKALLKDRQSEYYKGPNANKLQEEYRLLVDAKSRAA
jgi:hypothetical protein